MQARYETLTTRTLKKVILTVTLNRPRVLNAINTQMAHDLADLFSAIAADPGDIRCIVLTGSGKRAFCAGADLKEREGMSDETWRAQHEVFERAFSALMTCPVPVIAAVNGLAYGGGLELALCCDFIYATAGVNLALTEVRLGIMPGGGGTQNLSRAIGERRAKELLLTGRAFTSDEAAEWGLVTRLFAPGTTLEEATLTAMEIAVNLPVAVRQIKRAVREGAGRPILEAYAVEIEAYNTLVDSEERREAIRRFNKRRSG
ncbi:MAG: enoyl-CoA hydratase/isomerase family protein [Vicinamibacterales bacterium]